MSIPTGLAVTGKRGLAVSTETVTSGGNPTDEKHVVSDRMSQFQVGQLAW